MISGPHEVANARRLFLKSVADGAPDFRYVALAIGAEPFAPPRWAVRECIIVKDRTTRRPATRIPQVGAILDEVVRFYAREQFEREDNPELRTKPLPSLSKAIRTACATLGLRQRYLEGKKAETSWMKDVERAWKREQREDVIESYHQLSGWETTQRIAEIVEGLVADEFGHPRDLQKHLWMAGEISAATNHDK